MKNSLVIIVFLLCSALLTDAQTTISWTDGFKMDRKQRITRMIGSDGTNFFALQEIASKPARWQLHVYDNDSLTTRSISDIELPQLPGVKMVFSDVLLFGNRLLLISTGVDSEANLMSAYGTWLSAEGKPMDMPVLLGEQTTNRRKENDQFGFQLSDDDTKLLIYNESNFERKANERFTLKVIDLTLETLWKKDLELPYSREIFEINQYLVDNRGHVYMMSGISLKKVGNKSADRPNSDKRYVIISYDPDQNKVKEFDVSLDEKWVISTTFRMGEEGDLVIGGFYSNDRFFTIAGTFFFRVDGDSKTIEAKGLQPFGKDVLKLFMNERRAEKGLELDNFYFDHFILREDGGASLVAEQYYVTQRFQTDIASGRQEIQYFYHYDDILVVDIDAEGEINWVTKVPKIQVSINDKGPYSSYALTHKADTLYVVFNDTPDNIPLLEKNPDGNVRSFSTIKRAVVTLVKIAPDGTATREALFSMKDSETLVKPKVNLVPSDGELYLYSQMRKNVRFGRIQFGTW